MKQSKTTPVTLTPNNGCYITQSADVDIKLRIVAQRVILSPTSSADAWKEISAEEAEAILVEQARLISANA